MEVSNDAPPSSDVVTPPAVPAPRAAATREPEAPLEEISQAEYEKLLDQYANLKTLAEGEVVRGRILKILENEVIVDIGYKSEGVIPIEEFRDPSGQIHAEVGQEIEVLLEKTEDKKMRAYIINRQIDDIRGTLFRQTMFAEFEKMIHAIEERGDALTLDVFKTEYRALLQAYFGEGVVLDPQLDLECLRIPHFYHAFYVYKYATGISAAVALSERVLAQAAGSVESYINFLKAGGSKFPLETLQAAGVDMTTPAPIKSTLRLFEQRLAELEALLIK